MLFKINKKKNENFGSTCVPLSMSSQMEELARYQSVSKQCPQQMDS